MPVLALISSSLRWAIMAMILAGVVLIILRSLFNYLDVNPFTRHAAYLRRATEPILAPARAMLRGFRLDPKAAPLIVIILLIVAGYLVIQIAGTFLNTIAGVLFALTSHRADATTGIIGYLLFGFLGLYTMAIFVRIIFSWVGMSYANPLMRFVVRITEPLLGPLRRMVPVVGMFDISPLVAFLIIWVCQSAVASTLLHAWPVQFF
ncbi:MAG: YggT family protein [Pyrinomonadaceae bacterium]